MAVSSVIAISVGAATGALLRWWLGLAMNSIFPTIPLGTFTANVVGGFIVGVFMALTRSHIFFPEVARLAIVTGFLGGLTTFSTFSAETVTLLSQQEYLWTGVIILGHVGGSIIATICGIFAANLFIL